MHFSVKCSCFRHLLGENPKGTWRLKITDNPNQDDAMSFFGSDSGDDVETLEEQVIDTQTKLKKAQWDAMRKQVNLFLQPQMYHIILLSLIYFE